MEKAHSCRFLILHRVPQRPQKMEDPHRRRGGVGSDRDVLGGRVKCLMGRQTFLVLLNAVATRPPSLPLSLPPFSLGGWETYKNAILAHLPQQAWFSQSRVSACGLVSRSRKSMLASANVQEYYIRQVFFWEWEDALPSVNVWQMSVHWECIEEKITRTIMQNR